jgi:hypothetical protein
VDYRLYYGSRRGHNDLSRRHRPYGAENGDAKGNFPRRSNPPVRMKWRRLLAAFSCYCQIGWGHAQSPNARLELVDATQNPGWSPTVSVAAKSAMAARAEII